MIRKIKVYDDRVIEKAAEMWALGMTYQSISKALGMGKGTICRWIRHRPEFKEAKEKATQDILDRADREIRKFKHEADKGKPLLVKRASKEKPEEEMELDEPPLPKYPALNSKAKTTQDTIHNISGQM